MGLRVVVGGMVSIATTKHKETSSPLLKPVKQFGKSRTAGTLHYVQGELTPPCSMMVIPILLKDKHHPTQWRSAAPAPHP